ncbi:MAG: gamma-glutamylcyclotransferase [Alphaproteobacteria bacterium]
MANRDIWVFGYGSLMWRPEFPHRAAEPALIRGYHRAFCVRSVRYRGTRERPGLVLGLDRGGSCRGRAFRVAGPDAADVLAYLDEREMITRVYVRRIVPVELARGRVRAYTFVVDRAHEQYAGKLSFERAAEIILNGTGAAGDNVEYLENTVAHLDELGIADGPLHVLLRLVEARRAT